MHTLEKNDPKSIAKKTMAKENWRKKNNLSVNQVTEKK